MAEHNRGVTAVFSTTRVATPAGMAIAAALVAPVAAFALLRALPRLDLSFGSGESHFYVVSAVAALSLVLAVAVGMAARRLPEPRTFFLAMAFLSISTIFLAHGLGTSPFFEGARGTGYGGPSAEALARLKVVGYSAQLSAFVSALFFALATSGLGERMARPILRHWNLLLALLVVPLAGHVLVALFYPGALAWLPLDATPIRVAFAAATVAFLAFAGWRFAQSYRLALLPLQGAMAAGMVLLIQAQVFMLLGDPWRASWWLYHFTMLAGFTICVASLLAQYRLTGDLGAIMEGLFLRQQVGGIRAGDPRALVALGAAVAAKDTETSEHIERVGELAVEVGYRLGLAGERLEVLRWAGRLHDVGKIGVPNSILRKPAGLSRRELEVARLHSARGGNIALSSRTLAEAAAIIRAHHERIDGRGYPDGLAGEQIPLEARIVAVADVWDALTSDRPYRRAMSPQEAARVLAAEAGPHLDPRCVEALFRVISLEPARAA